jgi:hypothetical protein
MQAGASFTISDLTAVASAWCKILVASENGISFSKLKTRKIKSQGEANEVEQKNVSGS